MQYETEIQKNVEYITKSHLRNVIQIAVFLTGKDKIYGINIAKIQAFLIKDETHIVPTPSSNKLIKGVINIRGEYITLVNFDYWIGDEDVDYSVYKIIIVCNYNERKIAILIKDIIKIEEKAAEELRIPSGADEKVSYLTDVDIDGRKETCIIFDAEKLLSDAKIGDTTIYDVEIKKFPPINYKEKEVLIAEDSKVVIKTLHNLLKQLEINYQIFENGKLLIDYIQNKSSNEIGLVITDIEMPVMNGYQVIKFLKENEKFKTIPIVALTSMTTKGVEDKVTSLGAEKLINKANLQEVYETIKFYLKGSENG